MVVGTGVGATLAWGVGGTALAAARVGRGVVAGTIECVPAGVDGPVVARIAEGAGALVEAAGGAALVGAEEIATCPPPFVAVDPGGPLVTPGMAPAPQAAIAHPATTSANDRPMGATQRPMGANDRPASVIPGWLTAAE